MNVPHCVTVWAITTSFILLFLCICLGQVILNEGYPNWFPATPQQPQVFEGLRRCSSDGQAWSHTHDCKQVICHSFSSIRTYYPALSIVSGWNDMQLKKLGAPRKRNTEPAIDNANEHESNTLSWDIHGILLGICRSGVRHTMVRDSHIDV